MKISFLLFVGTWLFATNPLGQEVLAKKSQEACTRRVKAGKEMLKKDTFPLTTTTDCKNRAEDFLNITVNEKKKQCLYNGAFVTEVKWNNGTQSNGTVRCPYEEKQRSHKKNNQGLSLLDGDKNRITSMLLDKKYKKYRKKLRALLLLSNGKSKKYITKRAGLSAKAINTLQERYESKGLNHAIKLK